MSNKHTPGPWGYSRELMPETFGDKFNISQQDGAPYTPNYSDVAMTCSGDPIAVQEANARLIAAAPELLAALEKVLVEYHGYVDPDRTTGQFGEWEEVIAARLAIAKAKGYA